MDIPTWKPQEPKAAIRYREAWAAGLCMECPYSLLCITEGVVHKIKAIKAYRMETGALLSVSKKYVESVMLCE